MKQLEKMKVAQREEWFRNHVEQLHKIERDMEKVDMVSSLEQVSILPNYEDLLPVEISSLNMFAPLTIHDSAVRKGKKERNTNIFNRTKYEPAIARTKNLWKSPIPHLTRILNANNGQT